MENVKNNFDIILKPGKEKAILRGHPWVFSGAIAEVKGDKEDGALCSVRDASGRFLAVGYFNSQSDITVRIFTTRKEEFTADDLTERLEASVQLRRRGIGDDTDVYRLVNSEGDFLPGLIADRYGRGIVLQFLTLGMEKFRPAVMDFFKKNLKPEFIFEKSDASFREKEGMQNKNECVLGRLPEKLVVKENGLLFEVDIANGHKTGFYIDQRDGRKLAGDLSSGRKVCNCFSYTGGFSVYCARGGAVKVLSVDTSSEALTIAHNNMIINELKTDKKDFINQDIFEFLRKRDDVFDMLILDPPKFAHRKSDVNQAARGYKDINRLAMKRISRDGILMTYSCSQAVDLKLFRQIVFAAAEEAGRKAQILRITGHPFDHPVDLAHLEGEYLKGIVLRISD